ncbi:MAG TPA: acetate/propionate family kinase [Acidobacteriaceae bacterium]|nr:acetate/propionate family kinase [Acidobacteriaceae bacterium]
MNVLVLNPGGNSLKVEVVSCSPSQQFASDGEKLASLILEGIGKEPCLSVFEGRRVIRKEPMQAADYGDAAANLIAWLEEEAQIGRQDIRRVGLRVVHGGENFTQAVEITPGVEREIHDLERLAPLHNKNSLEMIDPVRRELGDVPVFAVFDTAFHRTLPDVASLYGIPPDLAQKHHIRRYGFHGTSHRYMMEKAARLLGKGPEELKLVTMHLESGCSVTAIRRGQSVENTMGLTPLEGLMMGTRSGDVDPSVIPFLVREAGMTMDDVMMMLNQKSGLLGVSAKSLDTRVLMKDYGKDSRVTLAMDMFSYRIAKATGAYLSVLNGADAIVFGGGIGENTALVRERVCNSLGWAGLKMDQEKNRSLIDIEGLLATEDSTLKALVVLTEEGLQIAHECAQAS